MSTYNSTTLRKFQHILSLKNNVQEVTNFLQSRLSEIKHLKCPCTIKDIIDVTVHIKRCQLCSCLFLYAVNRLTFEATAYYFTESFKLVPDNRVQLSQAPDAPVFAELQVEGGDGVHAATGEAIIVYYHILCIHCIPNQ